MAPRLGLGHARALPDSAGMARDKEWWKQGATEIQPTATEAKPTQASGDWWKQGATPVDPEPTSLARSVGDSAIALGTGVAQGVKMISDAAGAGNAVSRLIGKGIKAAEDLESDQRKAQKLARAQTIKAAEDSGSTWEEVKAYAGSFADAPLDTTLNAVGSVVPTLAAAALTGGGSAAAQLAARAAPMAIGAVQGAGAVKGGIYDAVEQRHLDAGATPEQAAQRADVAQAYSGDNLGSIATGAGLGVLAGSTGAEAAVRRLAGGGAVKHAVDESVKGIAKGAALGVAKEAPLEAVQGGQERLAANLAEQGEGFDTPTMRGVMGQAALEGLAAAPLGGGLGAVEASGRAGREASVNDAVDASPQALSTGGDGVVASTQEMAPQQAATMDGDAALPVSTQPEGQALAATQQDQEQTAPTIVQEGAPAQVEPVEDVVQPTVQAAPIAPSAAMGINPKDGPLSAVAAQAVDSGTTDQLNAGALAQQAAQAPQPKEQPAPAQEGVDAETGEVSEQAREQQILERLDYLGQQGRATGWTQEAVTQRDALQQELDLLNPALRMEQLSSEADAADAQARDWASRNYKPNAKPLPEHAAQGGAADVSEANEQRRIKAIGEAKGRSKAARDELQAIQDQGNADAALAAKHDTKALRRKKTDELSTEELQVLAAELGPRHVRAKTLEKAIQTRADQAQTAINNGVNKDGSTALGNNGSQEGEQIAPQSAAAVQQIAREGSANRQAEQQRKLEASERWTRMTTAERQAAAEKAEGLNAVATKNLHTRPWADISAKNRKALLDVVAPQAEAASDMKAFAPETGTLGIPRAEMPQVPTQSHGGLVKHLNAQGIAHETTTVDAAALKPTQAEYSPSKVAKAKEATGGRAVIVSSDGHIIDGHHQAIAAAEDGKVVKAIVLDAPVEQALEAVKNSPSASAEAQGKALFRRSDADNAQDFDVPGFLKTMNEGQPAFVEKARARSVETVKGTTDAIRKAWANGPEVVVAYDMADPIIPEAVRRADQKQRSGGASGEPEGFYHEGKAYLLASQLKTPNDAARVLFHEALGHHGLRGAFGKELDGILDQIATMRKADVDAKIQEYGLRDGSLLDRRIAAEEVLAEMAQSNPQIGFVKRAVAAIRSWLRKNVPGFQSLKLTDAEIINNYLLPARAWVERALVNEKVPSDAVAGRATTAPTLGAASRTREPKEGTEQTIAGRLGQDKAMLSRSARKPEDFVSSPDGGLDFGEISVEMGKAMRRQAGKIRLQQGVQNEDGTGWGLEHIEANHGLQIRNAGFASVEAFVGHIARGFNEVLQAAKGGQLLVAVSTGRRDVMFVQLEVAQEGDFYRVNTAFPASRNYLEKQEGKGAKILWSGSEPRSAVAGQQPLYAGKPEKKSGQAAPIAQEENLGVTAKESPRNHRVSRTDAEASGRSGSHDSGDASNLPKPQDVGKLHQQSAQNTDQDAGDVMFSRSKLADLKDKGMTLAHNALSHPGKVSLWDRTVGTMRHISERYPAFKPVFESAQQFIDDVSSVANQAAQVAPRLIPRVETLGDMLGKNRKRAISVADNKAIGKALFGGTLDWGRDQHGKAMPMDALRAKYQGLTVDQKAEVLLAAKKIDPQMMAAFRAKKLDQFETIINNKFESTILKAGAAFNHKELKEFFNLNDQQISLYDEARATVDKSLDITARAEMLRTLGRDWDGMRDIVMDAPTLTEAWKLLDDELEHRAKQYPDTRDRLATQMHQLSTTLSKAQELMDHGYMPLQRFGKYTLDVLDQNGERLYYGMFESKTDSHKMRQVMEREFPGAKITQGTMNEHKHKLMAGITPETAELFGSMLGLDAEGNQEKDKAFQEYLKLAKNNHSAMKRLIHRKGILGYSDDVGRVLASFVYSNARVAATGLNAGKMESAINDLNNLHKEEGELGEIAAKLRSYIQDPQEEGQAIRGMLFGQYLGGSLASAAVNMTQPFAVTLPWLSQRGGMAKASKYMSGALRDMVKRGNKYEPDLAHALRMAEDDGVVSPQEIHQLMAQARGAGGLRTGDGTKMGDARAAASNAWEKGKVAWGQPFALAEQFNRRSTFIAAYRLARDNGMDSPAQFARDAVVETQFLYTKANKPQWARGAVGGTLFTFKTYSVSFLELMQRTWNAGEAGSPERAAGRRAVGWAMLMLMLMGGAGGMPFVEDVEDLVDGAGQMMGYNLSSKQWRKDLMREVLGAELAEFMDSGLSGMPGAPIDVSGRLGMGNLIPGTGLLLSKQSNTRDVVEMMGPAGDLVARGFSGAKSVVSGVINRDAASIGRGAMEVMPNAVRNAAKGADMAASGIYKDTKGYKVVDTTLDEALWKAIGFQPRSVAEVQESNSFMQRAKSFYTQTSNDIRAQWAKALFEKDESAVVRVRERLARWNEQNPDQPIRINMPDIWKRARQMGKDRTARIADTAPTAIRQQMREFAIRE